MDISKGPLVDQIHALLGVPEVDCAVDAVGFEARGCGSAAAKEVPAQVLNDCMTVTKAGGAVGIPGLCVGWWWCSEGGSAALPQALLTPPSHSPTPLTRAAT